MADVSAALDRREGDDRGQLILIGGIVVAFALVALVVLLNTVLFAENVATRGIGPEIDRAHDHAAVAEDAGAAILGGENAPAAGHETWSSVDEAVEKDVDQTNTITQNRTFRRFGSHSTISVVSTRQGAVLIQNETRAFTSSGGASDFPLADTTGIRNFTATVDAGQTANPSASEDRFTITVTGSDGDSWWARVHAPDPSTVELTTSTGTTCTTSARVATINWTDETFGDCEFQFAIGSDGELSAPLRIRYENGGKATGTYRLVVSDHESSDDVKTSNFNGPSSTDNPRWYPGMYGLVLRATYEEGETRYATNVRVAPGEPTQTSPQT